MSDRSAGPLAACVRAAVRTVTRPPGSDADLLAEFVRSRDPAVFEQLVRRHAPLVLSACRHILADPSDADDACQATFVVLYRKANTIRAGRTLGGWLFRVARRASIEVRRTAQRRQRSEARAVRPESVPGPDLSWREACAILHEELDRLPDKYRLPLIACYLEGKTQDETARELGWSAEALRGRIDRGRAKLGQRLRKRGVTLSAGLLAAAGTTGVAPAITLPAVLTPSPAVVAVVRAVTGTGELATVLAGVTLTAGLIAAAIVFEPGGTPPDEPAKAPAAAAPTRYDALGDPLPDGAIARLGTVRFNHGDGLRALLYTPDGKAVVSYGWGQVRIWDAETRAEVRNLTIDKPSGDDQVVLRPDGRTLVILGGDDRDTIRMWDILDGKEVRSAKLSPIRGASSFSHRYALAPDGRLCATHSARGVRAIPEIRVYEVDTAKSVCTLPRTGDEVRAVLFAGNDHLVTAGTNKTIEVWEAATGKLLRQFDHGDPVEVLAASADGQFLATLEHHVHSVDRFLDRDVVHVWDLATGTRKHTLAARPKRWFMGVTFSPDGKFAVASCSGQDEYEAIVWDVATGKVVREVPKAASVLAVSLDGRRLLAGAGPGLFGEWDIGTGEYLAPEIGRYGRAPGIGLSRTGDRVVTIGYASLSTWDGVTGRRLGSFEIPRLNSVGPWRVVSPDGRWAVCPGRVGGHEFAHILDVTARKESYKIPVGGEYSLGTFAFSPDSTRLAVRQPGNPDATITIRDVRTGKEIVSFADPRTKWPGTMSFTDDGQTLVVAGHRIVGYSVADGKEKFSYRIDLVPDPSPARVVPGGGVNEEDRLAWRSFAVSPDGSLAACVLTGLFGGPPRGERLSLHDGRTGKVLHRWSDSAQQGRSYESIQFSPDGRLIASSAGSDVRLWEAATGKEVRTFRGHRNEIEPLAFSGNGRRLASGSWDSTVLIWDLSSPAAGDPADWWANLLSDDAAKAYAAVWRLADAADDVALPLFRKHLRPVAAADVDKVRKGIADLDSDQFRVRDRAFKELSDLGYHAAPALRAALDQKPSPEARNRIEQLLAKVVGPPSSGESLRTWRALAALEAKGTDAAKQLLRELADGAAGAWLTAEAKASLWRVERR